MCTYIYIYIVWRRHENTGSMVNTNNDPIATWGGCQQWTRDLRISDTVHLFNQRANHSVMTRLSENVLAPTELYHTLAIATSQFWAGGILHLAPYIWHSHVWRTHEHPYMHWQQDKYQLWSDSFMRWMPIANQRPQNLKDTLCHLNI